MKLKMVLVLLTTLAISGCGVVTSPAAPIPTVVLGDANAAPRPSAPVMSGSIAASGVVVPAQEVQLGFGVAGSVRAVHVAVGEEVAAGQLLAELDDTAHQALVAQAQAAVELAQSNYNLLAAGPTDEELRQAHAVLEAAQARLDELKAGPRPEQVTQAEANLASAQAGLALIRRGATELELQQARLTIEQAKGTLWAAQSNRDAICGNKALAEAQCDAAQAQTLVAETGVRQAENQLAQLQAGAAPEVITQAREAVRLAEAQLTLARQPISVYAIAAAQAQVNQAQAQVDALKAGTRAQQLEAAQAQVAAAYAQVRTVEAQANQLVLKAPSAGTVSSVSVAVGEFGMPGQPILALADLSDLLVETTDLSEQDVPSVEIGQHVTVSIAPLKQDISGRVRAIAPLAGTLGGDVVYKVTVDLDTLPAGLRAGMSAQVSFEATR